MAHTSNFEPRRFVRARHDGHRDRSRCVSCGARAWIHAGDGVCDACLDGARDSGLVEWERDGSR
jgi:hypothetical protein